MSGVLAEGPFPRLALRDLGGRSRPLDEAWSGGNALVLIGHGDCQTTRLSIPYLDRIHRRRARGEVRLVLQDDAEAARALVAELGLGLPVLLDEDPYPLAEALALVTVPTLFLLDGDGRIARASEAFSRADLEAVAERLGVAGPLFTAEDRAPAFRPG
jgi:hypothetical protein